MNPETTLAATRWWPPTRSMQASCALALILLVAGYSFFPVLNAGFITGDDFAFIRRAARVDPTSFDSVRSVFTRYQTPDRAAGTYQPLAILTLAVDAAWSRSSPGAFAFHLTGLALHLVNVALVFWLLSHMTKSLAWAMVGALLFGLHPLQVESVAWIARRGTLLGMSFALLAISIHVRDAHSWQSVAVVFFKTIFYLAAVLCDPVYVALPLFLMLLDFWPLRRTSWRSLAEALPLLVLMTAAWFLQTVIQFAPRPMAATDTGGLQRLAENTTAFLKRIVWPVRLSPSYPSLPSGASIASLFPIVATWVTLLVVAIWSLRRCRPLFFAIIGTLLFIAAALRNAPFSEDLLGDHYLYPALLAPALAVAVAAARGGLTWARPAGRLGFVGAGAVSIVFAVHSFTQTHWWESSIELFRHSVALYPVWPRAHCGLVEAALEENELDAALFYARRAVDVAPNDPQTQFYLGTALLLQPSGASRLAVAPLRRALESNPLWIACLQNLGVALARSGELKKAAIHLERARDLQPDSPEIRHGLGNVYLELGRPSSAREELEISLRARNEPSTHLSLARAWAAMNIPSIARRHLAVALREQPSLAAAAAESEDLRRICKDTDLAPLLRSAGSADLDAAFDSHWPAARSAKGS